MADMLDQQCIDTLRFLSVDMVQKADSGHPGNPPAVASPPLPKTGAPPEPVEPAEPVKAAQPAAA